MTTTNHVLDEIAIERRMTGDHTVALSRYEVQEAFERLSTENLSARDIAELLGVEPRTVVRWRSGESQPYPLPGISPTRRTATVTAPATIPNSTALQPHVQAVPQPRTIAQLLEDASAHSVKKITRLGARIETDLDALRGLLAEHAETEKQRQAEAKAKADARAKVERLQAQLAEAKKAAGIVAKPRAAGDGPAKTKACPECQTGTITHAPGPGRWPAKCDACKAAA